MEHIIIFLATVWAIYFLYKKMGVDEHQIKSGCEKCDKKIVAKK